MKPTHKSAEAFRHLFYNTGLLEPEQIEKLFIARQKLFQNILADILAERDDAAPQHHMIIGQRGMGKTTLLHRIAVELNKSPHCERFIPLTFIEEQHVLVERFSDFWLNALDALATAFDLRKQPSKAQQLDQIIRQLPSRYTDETDLANACRRELIEQCQKLGLRPVLLLDNFPLLLKKLDANSWDLRAYLQEAGAPILVAAALALPESLGDYSAAFFDMFRTRVLYNLTLEECREIYHAIAVREGRDDIIASLSVNSGRLKALHILTGGNPRTVGLLYDLFARGPGEDAWEDLRALLDVMTPLYQSRLDQLTDKGRKIFSALALFWRPMLQHEVETQTQLHQGTVSSTLQRLEENGVLERVERFEEKKFAWQVAERFFNIWFLMRFASRRTQGTVAALAAFLELFYSPTELGIIGHSLRGREMDGEQAHYGLAVAKALGESTISRDLCTQAQLTILRIRQTVGDQLKDLCDLELPGEVVDFFEFRDKILPALVPNDAGVDSREFARRVVSSISILNNRDSFRQITALSSYQVKEMMKVFAQEHIDFAKNSDETAILELEERLFQGLLTNRQSKLQWADAVCATNHAASANLLAELIPVEFSDAKEAAYRKAIELDEKLVGFFEFRDKILPALVPDDAGVDPQEFARRVVSSPSILGERARFKQSAALSRYQVKEMMKVFAQEHIDFAKNSDETAILELEERLFQGLLTSLKSKQQWESAVCATNHAPSANLLAELIPVDFSDAKEAAYRKAIELDDKNSSPWNGLGNLLQYTLSRYEESETAYRRAIELDDKNAIPWNNLGNLLQYKLGRYEESETAYRKAIELDDKHAYPWNNLGQLLQYKLSRYEEAETAYRRAIELDDKNAIPWNNLGQLLQYKLGRYEEAETAYRKSIELNGKNAGLWNRLGNLLADYFQKFDEAEKCYSMSLQLKPESESPKQNLVFLLRDRLDKVEEAEALLGHIDRATSEFPEVIALHQATFAMRKDNMGDAKVFLGEALEKLGDRFNPNSVDDWYRTAAVWLDAGRGGGWMEIWEECGAAMLFMPMAEAVRAHHLGDIGYIKNIPVEVQQSAREIFVEIERRRKKVTAAPAKTTRKRTRRK